MDCLTGETKWPQFIQEHFDGIRDPFTAGIELLPECNFRCVHCYAESDRKNAKEPMSTSEIFKILDTLEAHNCIELFFTGGECLLHKDFFEIYRYAKEKGMLVSVLTNASLITQKHIDLWLEYPPELISITIYASSPEGYQRVTQNPNGYAMFQNAVQLLRDNQIPFELKCIGMKQNLDEILEIREFTRSLGLSNAVLAWDIRPMNDGSMNPIDCRVSAEDAFRIELADPERKAFWDYLAFDESKNTKTRRQLEGYLYPCEIAAQFVFITYDGHMQGCVKAVNPRYDLLHGDFDEGWAFLGRELVEKKASPDFKCLHCDKIRYCEQCTGAFVDENGDPEKPVDFYCQLGEARKEYMDALVKNAT